MVPVAQLLSHFAVCWIMPKAALAVSLQPRRLRKELLWNTASINWTEWVVGKPKFWSLKKGGFSLSNQQGKRESTKLTLWWMAARMIVRTSWWRLQFWTWEKGKPVFKCSFQPRPLTDQKEAIYCLSVPERGLSGKSDIICSVRIVKLD